MTVRSPALARFTIVAAIVAAIDLMAKLAASLALGADSVPVAGPLSLVLTHNRASAFGVWLGAYTWQVNVAATFTAIALCFASVRALSAVDRRAPVALGLIAGAAAGNLTSLLTPPPGVADFLAIDVGASTRLVVNLADIAAYAGLALTARSIVLLGRAIESRRTGQRAIQDVEVRIPLVVERAATSGASRSDREKPGELGGTSHDAPVAPRL